MARKTVKPTRSQPRDKRNVIPANDDGPVKKPCKDCGKFDRLPLNVVNALEKSGQTGRYYVIVAWIEGGVVEYRREKRDFPVGDEQPLLDWIARDMGKNSLTSTIESGK